MAGRKRRRGKVGRWLERAALGTVMGAVAFFAERRLMKVIRRRNQEPPQPRGRSGRHDVEVSLPKED